MNRDIYSDLLKWKKSPRRKPLVLNGARQVGKTYALQHFGTDVYKNIVYLNFEKDESLSDYFSETLDPHHLLKVLEIHSDEEIHPGNTLLIFDEVQESPKALNSLKYFCEEASEYHIAAAGSLLGVKTAQGKGFPVGKVNFLNLYPLNFSEFISAIGHHRLRNHLDMIDQFEPLPEPIHSKLIKLLKLYFYVGGMPEAVAEYVKHNDLAVVREIQEEILSAYEKDFAKHAPPKEVIKITTVWKQIHAQLAKENKKFIFAAIRKSARGREYEEAIQWLFDAGLIHKSYMVETPRIPLSSYANESIFKIFLLDVGLLGAQNKLSAKSLIEGNALFNDYKGALTENYVAQELVARDGRMLYYWTSRGSAEIDFLISQDDNLYPLEIKSGENRRKKSLLVYGAKYPSSILSRATLMNLRKDGDISNYPLYLISKLGHIRA